MSSCVLGYLEALEEKMNACVQRLASDTERVMYAFISAKLHCEWTCSQTV